MGRPCGCGGGGGGVSMAGGETNPDGVSPIGRFKVRTPNGVLVYTNAEQAQRDADRYGVTVEPV